MASESRPEEREGEDENISDVTGEEGEDQIPKTLEQTTAEVELEPLAPKIMTLNERIREYVRTMHIPPVTNWRDMTDSEEEKEDKDGKGSQEQRFAEIEFPTKEGPSSEKLPEPTDDDWDDLLLKDKAPPPPKPKEEVHRLCLLDVLAYGTYFHMPYYEMEQRMEEQCSGCQQYGELGRCVCCGGSSLTSPYCALPKGHLKQGVLKESRMHHLMGTGRTFSETGLRRWESSERAVADVCGTKDHQDDE